MITNLENTAVQLSATKKDFYQIWNEILELAGKISERWDPTSTNESDPGIVLLKVLTAVADKLNYTIDANTLEAFMPSAAQEESMRKLTEMLGYSMKYYRSATTEAKISYITADHEAIGPDQNVVIDRFTNLKDRDDSINYVTLDRVELNSENTTKTVRCMEGELVECETDDDNIVSMLQLDDNNRYFLPETQIAENGIFVSNIDDNAESEDWDKVDNLNTQNIKTRCYKFGFDSREGLPYIQFPDDIANIIEDGLKIRYVRTNGVNGNISVNTLVRMEAPKSWGNVTSNADTNEKNTSDYYNADNYSVVNLTAANNGRNKESLNDAYNNYKKTIGTFDTLVTCRDYMNKIYQMTFSDTDTTNLVSNIIVSDIRDDINKAYTLCTFNEHGIAYEHMARELNTGAATSIKQSEFEALTNDDKKEYFENNALLAVKDGDNVLFYAKCVCVKNGTETVYDTIKVAATPISHFDLVFYPFRNVYGLNTKAEYVKSFQYDDSNITEIKQGIEANKTMSHNIVAPEADDLACVKNYLKLNAKITTTKKVNSIEQAGILGNVYSSIYANFNMRKIDFGEEIPYDSILTTIENADPRIKNVSLEEPTIITKYCAVNGNEYLTSPNYAENSDFGKAGDRYYNKLALNNVLAGRIPLFKYDENFKAEYTEVAYPSKPGGTERYDLIYPGKAATDPNAKIWTIKPSFNIAHGGKDIELNDNEVVQFRLPNLKTVKTYPAYVNYYVHLNQSNIEDVPVIPATMQTLDDFIRQNQKPIAGISDGKQIAYTNLINAEAGGIGTSVLKPVKDAITNDETFKSVLEKYKVLYYKDGSEYKYAVSYIENAAYYYIAIEDDTLSAWHDWLTGLVPNNANGGDEKPNNQYGVWFKLDGFYYIKTTDLTRNVGKLVDTKHNKYQQLATVRSGTLPGNVFTTYYIQQTFKDAVSSGDPENRHTENGLGQNGSYIGIGKGTEYELRDGEYLLVNYTSSTTSDSEEAKTVVNECYTGKAGVIIKPNFKLLDSSKYRETHSYSKTTGYDFSEFTEIPQPEGMFTLGVNEQIEIRDIAKVSLDEVSSNVYWELQNEVPDENGRILFNWDDDWVNKTTGEASEEGAAGAIALSHTLREGEYFYYTNKEKTDIAYYGSGTKITRTINTPKIYKNAKDSSISSEDIASVGLSAAIPWSAYNFSKADGIDRHIELTEYQYVNLINGDKLKTVGDINSGNGSKPTTIEVDISTNEWTKISSATYATGETEDKPLPEVNFADPTFCWEVTSRLELNVSPTETQTLHTGEYTEDVLSLEDKNGNNIVNLKAWGKDYPLSIKTNKLLQGSYTELDVTTKKYTDDGQIEEIIPELEVKVFKVDRIQNSNGEPITLNNFGEGNFTKFSFEDCLDHSKKYAELNAVIPDGTFGLIMFHSAGGSSGNAGIKLSNGAPSIYNNNGSWWNGGPGSDGVYRFRTGLNIVKIPASCKVELYSDSAKEDIIIFGGLDAVSGINPKLCYKKIEKASVEEQILADINAADKNHDFYYNAVISNSSNIDLNENDDEDTLENPLSWYNYNNINNRFVISEIDAGSLSNGIVIAKSSKL